MRFGLPRLTASILARVGANCTAFFLCFPACWAQSIPQGYAATREGDVIVMRPSAATDPDIAIRIYPPVADHDAADAVVRRWAESHPPSGVDPNALRLTNQTAHGLTSLARVWMDGAQLRVDVITMPPVGPGRYQPVVARMPTQPELMKKHTEAVGYVVELILRGQFQPNMPGDRTGNTAAAAPPVKPADNQTGPQRPAPGPANQTQATAEQVAHSVAQIETMGFESSAEEAIGGGTSYGIAPVALFRSGDALLNIGNLIRSTSVETDRAAHPTDWRRWRRTASGNEILEGGKWEKLTSPKTMPRLPPGFVLSGDYSRLTGGGSLTGPNPAMVVAQFRYEFRPDGKFSTSGFGAVLQHSGYPINSPHPVVEGRYRVDGYLLRLEPAGGQPETHVIVTDPAFLDVIWIDGPSYVRAH